jgi:hypothetical protein
MRWQECRWATAGAGALKTATSLPPVAGSRSRLPTSFPGGVAQWFESARLSGEKPPVRIRSSPLHGGRGVEAAPGAVNPAGAGSSPAGHPRADAEHAASSAGCNPVASRCGGSTPPIRTSPGDVAQLGRAPRLQRGRCRFDSDRLHFASVVSTASTRPLYGRGAGSTPAGGSQTPVAQWTECCSAKAEVAGSTPAGRIART